MATLHLACAAEGPYDAHSAAMLHSAAVNSGPHRLHVHYLHGSKFPRRSVRRIERMLGELNVLTTFHEVAPEAVDGLPVVEMFTAAMWYRIFLPELLPGVDRILYLDVDTLAVDRLDPLWEIDLSGSWLGAVTNVFQENHLHRPASIGLAGPEVYFNSGVLLMNLDEMRRDACTAELVRVARAGGPELEWPDQDVLNLVLGSRRLALHPRWNFMNSMRFPQAAPVFGGDVLEEARASPAIRHFEGPGDNKPWHRDCERVDRELYFRHRADTPWPRVRLVPPRRDRLRTAYRGRLADWQRRLRG
jgi:lipopolysaccharide biosynthesis glycosyltransferase